VHGLDSLHGIKAVLPRRLETELATEIVQKRLSHSLAYSHGAIALDIAMPSHRTSPAAGTADVSLEEEEIHHLFDRGDGISMLRESHRPAAMMR
jgi:hypothetical protein